MLNFQLSPEQLELQKKAREFALKEIIPVASYYDEIDETPLPVLKKAYESGLMNGDIPKKTAPSTGSPTAVSPITCRYSPLWILIPSTRGYVPFWSREIGRVCLSDVRFPN